MAAELGKLAQEFVNRGYSDFSTHLLAQLPVARAMGVPESFSTTEDLPKKVGFSYEDIVKQEAALMRNEGRKPTITLSGRINQKLPYDDVGTSYAFWCDGDERRRIILGTRNYHIPSYMKYI